MRRRPLAVLCLLMVFLLYLGIVFIEPAPSDFLQLEGKPVVVTGVVQQKELISQDRGQQTIIYIRLFSLTGNGRQRQLEETDQSVICYLKENQNVPEIGSFVRASGKLKCFSQASNPGQFDAESYYQILKISFQLNQTEIQQKSITYNEVKESLYQLRKKCAGILDETLPAKEASLMKTMLLGEKRAVDAELKELYQQNGIAHILAISGLHISLLGMTLYRLLKRLGVHTAIRAILSMGLIVGYVFMTGFSVSAIRAMIMFLIQMAAQLFKRTYDLITTASIAALLIVLEQPLYLYYSGFLFSFGCIYAIGLVVPAMTVVNHSWKIEEKQILAKQKKREKEPEGIRLRFLSGLALTLSCLPLQLWFFYQIPLYATLLNLLVIPLLGFLIPGGILLLLVGSFQGILMSFITKITTALVMGILAVYEGSCRLLMQIPGHLLTTGRPQTWQVVLYLIILMGLVLFKKKLSLKKKWMILIVGVWLLTFSFPRNMAVTFLDVGQGDCIHIRSREGTHYLVDGGSSSVSKVGEYRIIPYLQYQGVKEIEAVFITHPDEDHCNGILELLKIGESQGVTVKKVYLPNVGEASKTEKFLEIVKKAESADIEVEYLSQGQMLKEGKLCFSCIHPQKAYENSEENAFSLVLWVTYGEFQTLLTGDVEGDGEQRMMERLKAERWKEEEEDRLTVLKVAHHGSAYSTPDEMIGLLDPVYAVISCGENNSYGHPHRELLLRLQKQNTQICITYETGAITFETNGKKLWVTEFLKEK